jgi:peptidyl-tRNA hydrolase, PTH1 family
VHAAIVGLGNPGARYAATRHNVGFMVVDLLAARSGASLARAASGLLASDAVLAERAIVLAKPTSYMNRSGEPVAALCEARGIVASELLVVHDELDLPYGRVKLKRGGGTAGHRGLVSIAESLATTDFPRLRIGIGRPSRGVEVADFVLTEFAAAERADLPAVLDRAIEACAFWLELGLAAAMNRVNAAPPPSDPAAPPTPPAAREPGSETP